MKLRYSYRLEPTAKQRRELARAFGCARVIWNDGLRLRRDAHAAGLPYITDGDLEKRILTLAKRTEERAWLGEVSAVMLGQAVRDLNLAYRQFFASLKGKRKGRRLREPRFKSRKDARQSMRFKNDGFVLRANGRLYLAKVGDVKVRWSRALPSVPSSVTIIKDAAGRYFASFVVELEPKPLPAIDADVGIDLGLERFAVLSDGTTIANPRILRRAERKLRRSQRAFCRKKKGSANRAKAKVRVARAHARTRNTRRDWLHKLSTQIIRENQAVYVEDLAVSGLARTRLAKSVYDAGWSTFVAMLGYKAELYGRELVKIGRFEPTSQVCSSCGVKDGPKPLGVRTWACGACGAEHDRDHNAAKNILALGRRERQNACGGDLRPPLAEAVAVEAGIHTGRQSSGLLESQE